MGSGRFQIILEDNTKVITLMLIEICVTHIRSSCTNIFTLMVFNR